MTTERWKLVYVGFEYEPVLNDRAHIYRQVVAAHGQRLGRNLSFKKELLPGLSPGRVIEVDADIKNDGAIAIVGKNRVHTDEHWRDVDPSTAAAWAAMDRANTAAAHLASKSRTDEFEAALKPIRTAYLALPGLQRAQLLAQVVRFITAT